MRLLAFPPRGRWAGAALVWLVASCATPRAGAVLQRGAVVAEHPLATAVGVAVLEEGGNAADAAVATALALAVVFPQAGNLGGGGFALWVPASGEPRALDFRECAPAALRVDLFLDAQGRLDPRRSIEGPLAVGVPGTPHGLWRLFAECGSGRFGLAELAAPAIRLAEEGFAVDPWLARALQSEAVHARMDAAARERFYPGGRALRVGERLVQPELAETLRRFARRGPQGFYGGETASAIVNALVHAPVPGAPLERRGRMTLEDLRRYESEWLTPLVGAYRGREVIVMPPPSSGGLVELQVLGVLGGLSLEAEREPPAAGGYAPSARMLHVWIEAFRRSFADRAAHMGDPRFYDVPLRQLLSPEWIAERRTSIGERAKLDVRPWAPPPPPESPQTTHLSVLDRAGNAVSLTTTLNGSFGSGILVPGAGFLLNNEIDDFAVLAGVPNQFGLVGGEANALLPGKRPLSSMSPTVVRGADGRVELVLGSPGGPHIITAVTQVMLRVIDLEEPLVDAVRATRVHQQWRPATTWLENGFAPQIAHQLRRRGHQVEVSDMRFGSVQAIAVTPAGEPVAVSDPRRGGAAGIEGRGVSRPAEPPSTAGRPAVAPRRAARADAMAVPAPGGAFDTLPAGPE